MAGKRTASFTIRVDDDERAGLIASAAQARMSVSDYLRGRAVDAGAKPGRAPAVAAQRVPVLPFGVNHIDDLGPDPLRGRDKALAT